MKAKPSNPPTPQVPAAAPAAFTPPPPKTPPHSAPLKPGTSSASRKPKLARKTPVATDDFDEGAILDRIENGQTIAGIAATLKVDRSTLSKWLNANDHRSARAREARMAAAAAFDEQAELEIRAASNAFELSRARELAHHLRWRASKINPKAYGNQAEAPTTKTWEEALRELSRMEVPPHAAMPPGADL